MSANDTTRDENSIAECQSTRNNQFSELICDIENLIKQRDSVEEEAKKSVNSIREKAILAVREYEHVKKDIIDTVNANHDMIRKVTYGVRQRENECFIDLSTAKGPSDRYLRIYIKHDPSKAVERLSSETFAFDDNCRAVDTKLFTSTKYADNLTTCKFNVVGSSIRESYTEANLRKYGWPIDGWFTVKNLTDNTLGYTNLMKDHFKGVLNDIRGKVERRISEVSMKIRDINMSMA